MNVKYDRPLKLILVILILFTVGSAWAENEIPALGPNSVLKYYHGLFKRDDLIGFGTICGTDITGNLLKDLRILRNEIFAKYGRPFASDDLRQYFYGTDWYAENPAYHDGLLTENDRENVRRIQAVEDRHTDSFGLLDDLRSGKKVTAEDDLVDATFDAEHNTFIFQLSETLRFPANPVKCNRDIDRWGGYDADDHVFSFMYRGRLYFVAGFACGMRGTDTCYAAFSCYYNPRTHHIYNLTTSEQ